MSRTISRDSFARTELVRVTLGGCITGCDWCGTLPPSRNLYEYATQSDGGRREPISGRFCSVGCMRAYHDINEGK